MPDDLADIAGFSDATVTSKTGADWAEWCRRLDAAGARDLNHAAIAALVSARWPEVDAWWAQTITVAFERVRGLRAKGQLCTGDFAASKSRTFAVPVETLFAAFVDDRDWIGEETALRTATAPRSARLTWPDGSIVSAWFTPKGDSKSAVAIQHDKLPDTARREAEKLAWADRLNRLAARLAARTT